MKQHDAPSPNSARQMSLMFDPNRIDGMEDKERAEAVIMLAQILMQAVGLVVEDLDEDRR